MYKDYIKKIFIYNLMITKFKLFEENNVEKIINVNCVKVSGKVSTFTLGKQYVVTLKSTFPSIRVTNNNGNYIYLYGFDIFENKLTNMINCTEFANAGATVVFSTDSLEDFLMKLDMKQYNL
jgi:hypothetical protein